MIELAISLASAFAPAIVDRLTGPSAGKVAEKVIDVAKKITGKDNPQEAHDAIKASPELQLEFEREATKLEIEIAKEQTKQLIAVNETIREELKSDGIKGFWRPYNGVLFGTTLFIDYIIMPFIVLGVNVKWAHIEACAEFAMPHVPTPIYVLWGLILGVNGYTRGKEKLEKIKQKNGGAALPMVEILKNFGLGTIGL